MKQEQIWFTGKWRRILVDMHIPDWDPEFLSRLDPNRYVDLMQEGGATCAMVYANSHVGLCYYPTRTGNVHSGLVSRDFFGEVVELCHRRGLAVVAYYSLIFNNRAYIEHPGWRINTLTGLGLPDKDRYGTCCPNSPYRDFALAQTEEICSQYDCEGIFFDMTFWPGVCYCQHCIARYRKEEGIEPPYIIDWNNPDWMRFQHARERWMKEFADVITGRVKSINPTMTVTHQFSSILADWRWGVSFDRADDCDYLSGDFYGGSTQQSIVCKAFYSLSKNRPFEFHTSRCLDLHDHVTMKSLERMENQAFMAQAHGSAFQFIDAVDPDGQLNDSTYKRIRCVFDKMSPYEQELGGELVADVGVYFSDRSRFNPEDNGKYVTDIDSGRLKMPHWDAVQGSCRTLKEDHIPFNIVTRKNLTDLKKYQVIVLPDVLVMDEEEVEAIKKFVKEGGALYASFRTSIGKIDGTASGDFMLADLFGASIAADAEDDLTFFTPRDDRFKNWIAPQDHLIHCVGQVPIEVNTADVLATKTPPYTNPTKGEIFGNTFASIHSNPPGPVGTEPALVINKFGAGSVFYAAGALEAVDTNINRHVFTEIIHLLLQKPCWFEVQANKALEVVLFKQHDKKRMLINLIKSNEELVGVPLQLQLIIRVPQGYAASRLIRLPENETVSCNLVKDYAEISMPIVDGFAMFALYYS